MRQGLRALLNEQPDVRVVGEAADGPEATQIVERLKPDVLVVDMMMGVMSGIEVTRSVRKLSPKTCVVILSMHADEGYVLEALRAGAKAYVLKDSIADDLLHAMREAILGRRYLSHPLSEQVIEGYLQKEEGAALKPHERLTVREREVLHMLAQGLNNEEIAVRLSVSRRTVEVHRAHVMHKLGVHNQVQLLRYAIQAGITHPGK
ncbi:MAG TPA: response regulator transcription factor [Dehalococcoidia bacterium]|nr:response regulator transcription factor [Dehalococcoidia bacterium]